MKTLLNLSDRHLQKIINKKKYKTNINWWSLPYNFLNQYKMHYKIAATWMGIKQNTHNEKVSIQKP